jgi:hypothetical protein
LLWVSPPGDYAIVNSNHIPDGTHVGGAVLIADTRKIDRSSSIVPEGEGIPERLNFSLKSKAMRI